MNHERRIRRAFRYVFACAIILYSLLSILDPFALAYTSPGKPTGFVNDFANILTVQERQTIEATLAGLQTSTGAEVSVVTVLSIGRDETIETYAEKLFQEWGIGKEKEDNGLLILVAPNEREARIEVGYGLEGTVTDLQSGNIINKVMIPAFKEGNYGEGISGAVDAVVAVITNSPEAAQYSVIDTANDYSGVKFHWEALPFFIFVVLSSLARFLSRSKSWWLGGAIGAAIGAIIGIFAGFLPIGIIAVIILTLLGLLFDFIVSKRPPGSGGGGFWPIFFGGGRGGSGGSGFGGFGGGMSGGGGASGRW